MARIDVLINAMPPYPAQAAFIGRTGTRETGYSTTHFEAGMMSGKTLALCLKAWKAVTEYNPGRRGLITFPTYRDVKETFFPLWRELGLGEHWEYNANDHVMWFPRIPGSSVTFTSRSDPQVFRGPFYAWHIADELAVDKTTDAWELIGSRVRDPAAPRPFNDSVSTPKVGVYTRIIHRPGAKIIHATSLDNPYVNRPWLEKQAENFSPEKYKQEILAQEVSLSGRAWANFLDDKEFPHGNRHWARYDPARPWYIAVDIGNYSGYAVLQRHPATDRNNRQIWQGTVDVIVGEFTPNGEWTAETLKRVAAVYGGQDRPPQRMVTGRDINDPNHITGHKAMYYVSKTWGSSVQVDWPYGDNRFLDLQYDVLSGLILDWKNRRRLLVSNHLVSHDKENARGVLELMRLDQFPENEPKRGEFLPNDPGRDPLGLRHIRSALGYWAGCMYPIRLDGGGIKRA